MTSITPPGTRDKPGKVGRNRWAASHGGVARSATGRGHYDKDRPAIIAWVSRQGGVVIQATRDFTVKTVQKAADHASRQSTLYGLGQQLPVDNGLYA